MNLTSVLKKLSSSAKKEIPEEIRVPVLYNLAK